MYKIIIAVIVLNLNFCSFIVEEEKWNYKYNLHKENLEIGKQFILINNSKNVLVELPKGNKIVDSKGFFTLYIDYQLPDSVLTKENISPMDRLSFSYPAILLIEDKKGIYGLSSGGQMSFKKIINKTNNSFVESDFTCIVKKHIKSKEINISDIDSLLSDMIGNIAPKYKNTKISESKNELQKCSDPDCRSVMGLYSGINDFHNKNMILPIFECTIEKVNNSKESL